MLHRQGCHLHFRAIRAATAEASVSICVGVPVVCIEKLPRNRTYYGTHAGCPQIVPYYKPVRYIVAAVNEHAYATRQWPRLRGTDVLIELACRGGDSSAGH